MWVSLGVFLLVGFILKSGRASEETVRRIRWLGLPFLFCFLGEGALSLTNEYFDQSVAYSRRCHIASQSFGRNSNFTGGTVQFTDCPEINIPRAYQDDLLKGARTLVLSLRKGALGKEWLEGAYEEP